MKTLQFQMRIMKMLKNLRIPLENHEDNENLIIPLENHENHENPIIPLENQAKTCQSWNLMRELRKP